MDSTVLITTRYCGRTSHGVRGLKSVKNIQNTFWNSRTSYEVRGLKSTTPIDARIIEVAPRMGCVD